MGTATNGRNFGLRFFAAAIVVIPSGISFLWLATTPRFEAIYSEMLGDKPLPVATQLVLSSYPLSLLVPVALFATAVTTLFASRREQLPYFVAGVCLLLLLLTALVVVAALYLPLLHIIADMQGGG